MYKKAKEISLFKSKLRICHSNQSNKKHPCCEEHVIFFLFVFGNNMVIGGGAMLACICFYMPPRYLSMLTAKLALCAPIFCGRNQTAIWVANGNHACGCNYAATNLWMCRVLFVRTYQLDVSCYADMCKD